MNKVDWKLVLDKFGTIIVDRRFWLKFVIPTAMALGIFPFLANANAETLSDQAVSWATLIVGSVVPVVSAWLLSSDWTKRAPSGLGFKEVISEVEDFVKTITDALADKES